MSKFYCVSSTYFDDGRISANLVDICEAEEKPKDAHKVCRNCDRYCDWFATSIEAEAFIAETRRQSK